MNIKRYILIISGRVQGVSYRMSARDKALQLGLTGWVTNLSDGRVEMLIEGDTADLERMRAWAGQGPRFAKVSRVEMTEHTASGEFKGFEIR